MKIDARFVLVAMPFTLIGFVAGLYSGSDKIGTKASSAVEIDPEENDCSCGAVRTCAFGPGIVGRQKCWTSVVMGNEWTRCEPVPEAKAP